MERAALRDARETIIKEAASGRYGMIVLSAHRRPFSTDAIIGSTVERLLRKSSLPVLAFPEGRSARRR